MTRAPESLYQASTGINSPSMMFGKNGGGMFVVRGTCTAVAPTLLYATGYRRMGGVVTTRVVLIMVGISTSTKWRRRLRYLGYKLARETVMVTTSTVVANALESYFVEGHPIWLANWEIYCSITMKLRSTSEFIPGVVNQNIKVVGASHVAAYIFQAKSAGPAHF